MRSSAVPLAPAAAWPDRSGTSSGNPSQDPARRGQLHSVQLHIVTTYEDPVLRRVPQYGSGRRALCHDHAEWPHIVPAALPPGGRVARSAATLLLFRTPHARGPLKPGTTAGGDPPAFTAAYPTRITAPYRSTDARLTTRSRLAAGPADPPTPARSGDPAWRPLLSRWGPVPGRTSRRDLPEPGFERSEVRGSPWWRRRNLGAGPFRRR